MKSATRFPNPIGLVCASTCLALFPASTTALQPLPVSNIRLQPPTTRRQLSWKSPPVSLDNDLAGRDTPSYSDKGNGGEVSKITTGGGSFGVATELIKEDRGANQATAKYLDQDSQELIESFENGDLVYQSCNGTPSTDGTIAPDESIMVGGVPKANDSMTVNSFLGVSGEAAAVAENSDVMQAGESRQGWFAPDDYDSSFVRDAVNAILIASEEAVATAEASLLTDAAMKLETFPRVLENDTQPESSSASLVVTEILPASSVVGDSTSVDKVEAPTLGKIIRFAIPATGVWLCSPLLSLIDTSAVGLLSGTVQQAALNPAVAVTEYSALLIAFLYTGTTNLIAAARERDRRADGSPRTTARMIGALQLSNYVGIGLGTILFFFASSLVRVLLGKGDINPAVFEAAVRYVRIRALGMPAAAVIGTAQAACLGMQDVKSPLYVLLAAAVVNFIGDMIFVGSRNPWIGGAAGAAWATSISQYAAVGFFIHWLCNKPRPEGKAKTLNISNSILEMMHKPTSTIDGNAAASKNAAPRVAAFTKNIFRSTSRLLSLGKVSSPSSKSESLIYKKKEKAFSARGFLEGKIRKRDLIRFPPRYITKEFSPYVLPVTSTQLGRVSGYVAMSHVISSCLGTLAMAAQQVIISFFYSFAPIADSLGLTAQSFIPSIAEKSPSKERAVALRRTMINLAKVGILFGAVLVALIAGIPAFSRFSTSDPIVISLVTSVIPYLLSVSVIHSFVTAFEGTLLGQKDLGFVGKMYALWFVLVPFFMLRVKKAALMGHPVGLTSVWKVFLVYHISRFFSWVGRALILQRQTEREAERISGNKK